MYFQFYFWFLLLCATSTLNDKLIDKLTNTEWYCADINCTDPIAIAKSTKHYPSNHHLKINLKPQDEVNILGKPIDTGDLWLVSLGDKLGVAPKDCLREWKIFVSEANCMITKFDFTTLPGYKKALETIPVITPSPPHSVIHGTTLYDVSNSNSYDVPDSDTDLATTNITTDTVPNLIESSEINNDQNKNDTISEPHILTTAGSVTEPKPNETDTISKSSISPTLPLDSKNVSELISSDAKTESNSSNVDTLLDALIGPKLNSNGSDNAVESDQPSFGSEESNSKSEANKENMDNNPFDTEKNSLFPDKVSQEDVGKLEPYLQNESNTEGKTEVWPESETDILPKTKTETLLLSKTDTLPESETEDLPESKSDTLPESKTEDLPEGKTDTLRESKTEDLLESKTDTLPESKTKALSESEAEGFPESKTEALPESSKKEDFEVEITEEMSIQMTSNTQNNFQNEPDATKTFNHFHPTAMEHERLLPSSTENPTTSPITHFTLPKEPTDVQANYSSDDNIGAKSTEKAENLVEIKQTASSTPELVDSNSKAEVKVVPDAVIATVHSAEEKDISNLTPALGKSDESYVPPITPDTQNSAANAFVFSLHKTSEVGTSASLDNDLSSKLTNYDHSETTPRPDTDKLEYTANEASVISLENNVDLLKASLEQASTIPPVTSDNISPTEAITEESNTENLFSSSSIVENIAEELFAKSDLDTNGNNIVQDIPEEHSNLDVLLDKGVEENRRIEESNEACEKDNCFDQSSEHISEKVDDYFGPLAIPSLVGPTMSLSTFIYLTITSVVILIFSLGYYYLENMKQTADFIGKINSLSAELFFAQKELATMEEKLSKSSESFDKMVSNTTSNEEALMKMKQEFEESEAMIESLELENKRLKKEIDSLVESGNEMHRMLAESITDDEKTQSLLANIDDLKTVLSNRLEEIASLTDQLDREKQEVELLTIALQKTEEKKENLEEKLEKLMADIDSKALSVANEYEEKVTSLEKIIEESSLERTNFEKEIVELKRQCETLSVEKELAEKALKKAQGMGPGKALSEWLDSKAVRTELLSTQKEVEKLRCELEDVKNQNTKLLERESNFHSEIEILNNNYETAEKNKIEALTKLQVLSNYFKEKETQLQEELGTKEAQWLQKQSEDHTIYEQMRSLREENLSFRAQNDALKKEILDQEASFKIQIANEEQKAQENWVTLRHTERRLKEAQMEAAHLRSRLTAMETNPDTLDDKHGKSMELVNGEVPLGAASPPFMLYSPDFIPLPPLVSPSRPPPLGRLSSPPLTPPPPLSPYDLFPPPSPPPPLRVHKPQPREPPTRKQKDSQSSNHSSESIEKPVRRGKR